MIICNLQEGNNYEHLKNKKPNLKSRNTRASEVHKLPNKTR
jgi:hypothetical protein